MKCFNQWVRTHRYCLAGLYVFVFLLGFFALELIAPEPKYILHCRVDDWIPFCEWFVLPYILWYLWIPSLLIWFMLTDKESYLRLCFVIFAGATVSLFIYMAWPNGLELRREITADNICAWLVKALRRIDPPCNVCPSLHVSSTVAVHLVALDAPGVQQKHGLRTVSWVVSMAICLSTMLIKQHSFIDVTCGAILSLALDLIWKLLNESRNLLLRFF